MHDTGKRCGFQHILNTRDVVGRSVQAAAMQEGFPLFSLPRRQLNMEETHEDHHEAGEVRSDNPTPWI